MFRIFHKHDAECIRVLVLGEHGTAEDIREWGGASVGKPVGLANWTVAQSYLRDLNTLNRKKVICRPRGVPCWGRSDTSLNVPDFEIDAQARFPSQNR